MARYLGEDNPDATIGRRDLDIFHEGEDSGSVDSNEEAIEKRVEQIEWPDGKRRWISSTQLTLRDEEGSASGSFWIGHDVSKLKEAQTQLSEVASRLALPCDFDSESPDPVQLANFSLQDMIACGSRIRGLSHSCDSAVSFAESLIQFLHQGIVDEEGQPAFSLVRLFRTRSFSELDSELQEIAASRQQP